MVLRTVAALVVSTAAAVELKVDPVQAFKDFTEKFSKDYNGDDPEARFGIFKKNLIWIEKLNRADPGAPYSYMTPFADVSPEEFKAQRQGFAADMFPADAPRDEAHNTSSLPTAFDWREKGAVNAVKDQKQCGSCWAFSTVANIEGANFVTTGKLVSLSEQELVDCDHNGDHGCQGGLPSNAFKDMITNKLGLEPESAYPYTAANGKCAAQTSKETVFISSWKTISTNEDQMAAALMQYGPLSIGLNAGPMQWYHGGVANPFSLLCNPSGIDHGVAIVAFGVGTRDAKPIKYWTIRNSWGTIWGEKGYYRIVRGVGKCGLNSMVTTAVVGKAADVLVV